MSKETLAYDMKVREQYPIFVGCDEVGRGCLAGPIITAAVILPPNVDIPEVNDSKQIKKQEHEHLAHTIFDIATEVQLGIKSPYEIDQLNILEADKAAMTESIMALHVTPDLILIDGDMKQLLNTNYSEKTVIKGDSKSLTIGAASIIAKFVRDKIMTQYDSQYPGYGFATNAGYGTVQHRKALSSLGITPIHRKSFEPIKSHVKVWPTNLGVNHE